MTPNKKGRLIVLSGPAGTGKSTVLKRLFEERKDFCFSVSATSRKPRPGETDGVDYFYVTREKFEEYIRDDMLLEHTEYIGNYYGTPRDYIRSKTEAGINVVLDIEVEGAMQVRAKEPSAILVFMMPPDYATLRARLYGRGTEPPEIIEKRLTRAKAEIEISKQYDYIITNYDGREYDAALDLSSVVRAHSLKASEQDIQRTFYNEENK